MPEEQARGERPDVPTGEPDESWTVSAMTALHSTAAPAWVCDDCGADWPCPAWTSAPTDAARRAELLPEFVRLTRRAIHDLRGRPGGPQPPEIVRRFLWFLSLNDEEARAVARRLR
ncbi:hypothetical protein O7602_12965 [Micromonospora sp. WMMD1128]|uniref:hypothetical protein n=1 Tax=Micromonospora sp. WMMD1128 TaxID=3015150 RepID=UPI00248B5F98|nr:hypothetical protein [Micromonospora sp. WMMD1128]WBB76380.1 hypothetical protein O7602_12965 [Micromonospora sp. WMMD1128]